MNMRTSLVGSREPVFKQIILPWSKVTDFDVLHVYPSLAPEISVNMRTSLVGSRGPIECM